MGVMNCLQIPLCYQRSPPLVTLSENTNILDIDDAGLVRKPEEVEERRKNLQLHIFPGIGHNSQAGVGTFFMHMLQTLLVLGLHHSNTRPDLNECVLGRGKVYG